MITTLTPAVEAPLSTSRSVLMRAEDGMLLEVRRTAALGVIVLLARMSNGLRVTLELSQVDAAVLSTLLRQQADALAAESAKGGAA
jgi:hypothetical protein